MIRASTPLAELIDAGEHGGHLLCQWPGCEERARSNGPRGGWCDKHRLRVARGWEPGCETAWEWVVASFAKLLEADSEDDRAFDQATQRAQRAAEVWFATRKRARAKR